MSNPTPNRAVITVFAQTQFLPNANVRIGQKTATQLAKGVFVRGYGLLGVDVSMKLTHAMTNVPAPPMEAIYPSSWVSDEQTRASIAPLLCSKLQSAHHSVDGMQNSSGVGCH